MSTWPRHRRHRHRPLLTFQAAKHADGTPPPSATCVDTTPTDGSPGVNGPTNHRPHPARGVATSWVTSLRPPSATIASSPASASQLPTPSEETPNLGVSENLLLRVQRQLLGRGAHLGTRRTVAISRRSAPHPTTRRDRSQWTRSTPARAHSGRQIRQLSPASGTRNQSIPSARAVPLGAEHSGKISWAGFQGWFGSSGINIAHQPVVAGHVDQDAIPEVVSRHTSGPASAASHRASRADGRSTRRHCSGGRLASAVTVVDRVPSSDFHRSC